jgi:hypothetical protein
MPRSIVMPYHEPDPLMARIAPNLNTFESSARAVAPVTRIAASIKTIVRNFHFVLMMHPPVKDWMIAGQ